MSVTAQTITTLQDLENLRADWRRLWRACAASVFQSPDWLIPWWRHFAPGQLTCIAVWRGDDLVGLAPLYREEGSTRLLPLGISLSDSLDVLIPEGPGLVLCALQEEIARIPGCSEVCFPDVAPDACVLSLTSNRRARNTSPAQTSPELPLGPPDDCLRHVPPHQRQNLRTAENRARRRGCALADVSQADLPRFLPALMQLHCARQRHLGRGGLGADARVLPFFREAFGALAGEGVVRAYSLICEGRLSGGYLGFLHRGRASYYFGGFDPKFAFESPGTILIGHAMRCAAAEGARMFDFLRGAEPYKYAWGAQDRRLLSLSFAPQLDNVELAS